MKFAASTARLNLRFNPKNVISPVTWRYLSTPLHPLRPKLLDLHANREKDILWWRVSVKQLQKSFKRVVRSWCARRVRSAFTQAMKQRGFDANGRRILQPAPGMDMGFDLKGTIELTLHPQCVKEEYPVIQEDLGSMLDSLLQKLKDYENEMEEKRRSKELLTNDQNDQNNANNT